MTVRLLIVEDTEHVRKMLVDILGLHGFEVAGEAGNGEEAVVRTRETDPDVIVMDYKMPGSDGLAATRAIRSERPDQAVILYSAYLDPDLEQAAKEAGVAVCIPKVSGVEALAREISAIAMDLGNEEA